MKKKVAHRGRCYLMEAQIVLDGVGGIEYGSFGSDDQHKAVQSLSIKQVFNYLYSLIIYTVKSSNVFSASMVRLWLLWEERGMNKGHIEV